MIPPWPFEDLPSPAKIIYTRTDSSYIQQSLWISRISSNSTCLILFARFIIHLKDSVVRRKWREERSPILPVTVQMTPSARADPSHSQIHRAHLQVPPEQQGLEHRGSLPCSPRNISMEHPPLKRDSVMEWTTQMQAAARLTEQQCWLWALGLNSQTIL